MFTHTYDCSGKQLKLVHAGSFRSVAPAIATDDGEIMCKLFGVGAKMLVTATELKMPTSVEVIRQALRIGANHNLYVPKLKEVLRA